MTSDPESTLFDFAASNRPATNEEEKIVTELHAALGTTGVPLRLRRPPVAPRFTRGERPWRSYFYVAATIALALAITLGGFFTTRQDSSPTPTEVPEVVLGLAGQDASPETASETCDFSGDIPLFSGLVEVPLEDPALLLSPTNELTRECNNHSSLILENVQVAGPTTTPHVIIAMTSEATHFINIVSEEQIVVPLGDQPQMRIAELSPGSWIVSASTSDPAASSIYNLSTMTETPILDASGLDVDFKAISDSPISSTENSIVIAVPSPDGLAGFFFADSHGNSHFISVPASEMPQRIKISPSADTVASSTYTGTRFDGTTEIALYNVADGSEGVVFPLKTQNDSTEMAWLLDGSMLMLTDGNGLYGLHSESPSDGMQVLVEGQLVQGLTLTPNEDIVVVSRAIEDNAGNSSAETLIVNVRTGESTTLPGHDMFSGLSSGMPRTALVLVSETDNAGVVKTLSVVEASTGTIVGEISDPPVITDEDSNITWGTSDYDLKLIAYGPESMWRIVDEDGKATLDHIPPPEELDQSETTKPAYIKSSASGYLVLSTFEPTEHWMKAPYSTEWLKVDLASSDETGGVPTSISIIPGSNQQPEPEPEASPIAVVMRSPHEPLPGIGAIERDMPVLISEVDSLSESADWYRFNPTSSWYRIRFDNERGFAELEVRNGAEIRQTFYPNIFLAYVPGGVHVVNISSLSAITIQTEMSADDIDRFNAPISSSRWIVIQDANLVIDTHTMNAIALNEVLGITSDRFAPHLVSMNKDGSQLLIAITVWDGTQFQWRLAKFNPDGTAELIPTAESLPEVLGLALSPDGERAIVRSSRVENNSSVHVFTVLNLSSGESTDTYEHPGDLRTSDPVWIENRNEFIYSNHGTLFRATLGESKPVPLYEAKGTSLAIYETRDPNIVVLIQNLSYTSPDPIEMDDPRQIILVNVETGESSVHQGVDQTMSPDPSHTYTRNVILLQTEPNMLSGRELHVEVIDPVTGEHIGTIERDDPGETRPGAVRSGGGHKNGDLRFMSWGSQYTYQVTTADGNAVLRQISSPPGSASEDGVAVGIRSSNDASWLAMNLEVADEWWLADLSGSEPEWEQLPDFDQIFFVTSAEGDPALTSTSSPVAAEVCDFSGEIPFIAGLNESPLDSPTVLHTTDRMLVTDCNGEQTTLLEDVKVASPTLTPHVIHAITGEGDHFINIVTDEELFIPAQTDMSTSQIHMQPWGPWMVMRSTTDETKASVYNLETMTETPLITHARVALTLEDVTETPMYADEDRFVLAYTSEPVPGTRFLNGFFIVEADGTSKVVVIGQEAEPRELAVSPDGQLIATASFNGSRGEGTTTITLFRPEDDTIVQQYQLQTMNQHVELTWQHDGSGLLLHDVFNLYRIDAEHPGDGLEILAEGQNLENLLLTPDNDVVAISHNIQSQTHREATTLIVHIPTREIVEVEGHDIFASPYITSTRTTLLLEDPMESQRIQSGKTRTVSVVNAVTGDSIGEIEFEPLTENTSFQQSSWGTGEGDISAVAFRPDSMWKLVDENGNPTLEQISPPPLDDDTKVQALTIVISQDGYLSLRIFERETQFTAWLMIPDSNKWIQLDLPPLEETQGMGMLPMVTFIRGED